MEMKNNFLLLLILSLAGFWHYHHRAFNHRSAATINDPSAYHTAEVGLLISAYVFVVTITEPFITLLMRRLNKKYVLLSIMLLFPI